MHIHPRAVLANALHRHPVGQGAHLRHCFFAGQIQIAIPFLIDHPLRPVQQVLALVAALWDPAQVAAQQLAIAHIQALA